MDILEKTFQLKNLHLNLRNLSLKKIRNLIYLKRQKILMQSNI